MSTIENNHKAPIDELEIFRHIHQKTEKSTWIYFPGQLFVVFLFDFFLYPYVPIPGLILWNILHLLNFYFRFRLLSRHLRHLKSYSRKRAEHFLRFYFGSLLMTGTLWAIAVSCFHYLPLNSYFLLYTIVISLTFASTSSLGVVRHFFYAYTLPMNLVMFLDLIRHGESIYIFAAIVQLFSFFFSIRSANIHLSIYARIIRDEAEAERLRRYFETLAGTDSLTGLPNRYRFLESFEEALQNARREDQHCALFFLDLDRFKIINDTRGHHTGDRVLVELARRLKNLIEGRGMVARLAGDEFVIWIRGEHTYEEITRLAWKIYETLQKPITIDGESFSIHTSLGIVSFPEHGSSAEELLHCADKAMYESKKRGTPRWYCKEEEESDS